MVSNGGTETVLPGGTTGSVTIATSGSLELGSGTRLIGYVTFDGRGCSYIIDDPLPPSNPVSGFATTDKIDLRALPFNAADTVSLGLGNLLEINESNGSAVHLQLGEARISATRISFSRRTAQAVPR